ncbi:MAG: FKBP-type peptidyl-prolyl cis-trans isomerase [Verrucomicrobiales bacterium]|nr:FKBP-type peptidyl-prolyl cis-trans isomerase [Verrucomicrobiales bacterium]
MKQKRFTIAPVVAVTTCLASLSFAQDAEKPETLEDRISYAYGVVVAKDLKDRGLPINKDQFLSGFAAIFSGSEPLMTDAEIGKAFDENQLKMDEQNATGPEKENLQAGKDFLAENAKKEGVKVTDRGLQYKVLKEGEGPKPTAENTVKVHYHGTLIDGTVFDSSVDRGEPISFPLMRVIPGWTEGLQLMSPGAKYRLFIPYNLAYGDSAAGPKIKPYSALIFDVELLEVQ